MGWLFPIGPTKSQAQTSPLSAAARIESTWRRTGSETAPSSWANLFASPAGIPATPEPQQAAPCGSVASSVASVILKKVDGESTLPGARPTIRRATPPMSNTAPLPTRLLAEAIGSGFLVMAVIGSGIMAETLSPDDVGLQLLENAAATAGALVALIVMFATVSGAHFNPAVTLVDRLLGSLSTSLAAMYVAAQVVGGCVGAMVANAMFSEQTGEGIVFLSQKERDGWPLLFSEIVATVGLLLVIHGALRLRKPHVVAVCVGVWIGGAYFFTSSTSFANPQVTVARTLSDTFAGIAPTSAPGFVAMQVVGALIAFPLIRHLFHYDDPEVADA